ncbi:MAG: rRNA maturation RNase YbeY [Nitrosomonadales bacterium]|nr:rRNA maturation RNase YbeY [Nitrosomonadales bacterium]
MSDMKKTERHELSLSVQYASAAQRLPSRPQLRRWVQAALQCDAGMTLRFVDEAEGRELNRNYRGKDYATNVLTFIYDDAGLISGDAGALYGDIIICAPVVEREAMEQGKALSDHYAHMVIHAALHLQGYDHENDRDAEQMEALEVALMLKLRRPNPYSTPSKKNGRPRKY